MSIPLAITATGLITSVGLNSEATCAAIRCAIDNVQETRFMDAGGEWLMAAEVPLEQPWRGETKLIKMAVAAINECLEKSGEVVTEEIPLLLCLAESERPGRVIQDDNQFFLDLQEALQQEFHFKSRIIAMGHVSIAVALQKAAQLISEEKVKRVLIASTDSLVVGRTLAAYEEKERLLSSKNSNGFIAGEAGAAIMVEVAGRQASNQLVCKGIGFGVEKAHIDSEEPLRADGLVTAIRAALKEADCEMGGLDFRITDLSGEQYYFKEASLALARILRQRKEEFDIWHPADCVGEVGVPLGLIMLSVLKASGEKNYSKGAKMFAHLGNDDGRRVAMVFNYQAGGNV